MDDSFDAEDFCEGKGAEAWNILSFSSRFDCMCASLIYYMCYDPVPFVFSVPFQLLFHRFFLASIVFVRISLVLLLVAPSGFCVLLRRSMNKRGSSHRGGASPLTNVVHIVLSCSSCLTLRSLPPPEARKYSNKDS